MKKATLILMIFIIAACNNEKGPNEIRQEIAGKKKKISELKKEISNLESQLKEDTARKIPVKVKEIQYKRFEHFIEVTGSAESVKQAQISPETNGQIQKIYVEEGDRVEKGQLLVRLKTEVTRSSIEEVKTSLELAQTTFEKQKELWEDNIGSEMEYLQAKNRVESLESRLETLRAQLDMAEVRAPFKGTVEEVMMKEGELASPGMRLVEVINLDQIKIEADVSENYLSDLKEGEMVTVEFPAYYDFKKEVPIDYLGNIVNPENRTFSIQLKMDNRDGKIKPNIIAVLHINDYSNDSAMVVPSIILKRDIEGFFLFTVRTVNGSLKANKVYVETGKSYQTETEVLSGLQPGDRVIIDGYNMVTTGTEVKTVK